MTNAGINYFISSLLTAVTTFLLAIFVFSKNPKSKLYRIFFLYSMSIFAWSLPYAFMANAPTKQIGIILGHVFNFGVSFICVFFAHFVLILLEVEEKKLREIIRPLYIIAFIFTIIVPTKLMVKDVVPKFGLNYFINPGPAYYLYIVFWYSCIIFGMFKLFTEYKKSTGIRRNQLKYLFFGSLIGYTGGPANFLLVFDIKYPFYPFGTYAVPFYTIIIAYAIVRHQLMDINIVIRRTLVYSTLVALITSLFAVIILLFEKFLQGFTGYKSLFVSALAAFIIALGFNPVKNMIQKFIDRHFFKGTVEEISYQNERLMQEVQQSEKMKAVATLAAGMAHEIKNPLTAIKTFACFMPKYFADKEFIDKFNRIVPESVNRIDRIVKDVLAFSKPTPPVFKLLKITEVITHTLDYVSNDLVRNNINYSFDFKDDQAIIPADFSQLTQVFLNLYLNAIEAMPAGGHLTIFTKMGKRDGDTLQEKAGTPRQSSVAGVPILPVEGCPQSVEIRIQDTGCGISPENLKHIFDPFFTTKDKGTGLGLSIVREIVANHRGNIKAESEAGKGTVFILEFPAVS